MIGRAVDLEISVHKLVIATLLALSASAAAADEPICSVGAPCVVEGGEYHLRFPTAWDGEKPLPALLFFHGHRSSGEAMVRSKNLARDFVDHGYLLIAPNGAKRGGDGARGWPARDVAPSFRDDLAFIERVMDDVEGRVPLRADQVLVSGFSSGGSMAWYLACHAGSRYAAFAPVAGGLRYPHPPEPCPAGPVRLLHIHGFADLQVPLEGRGIREWHQGDVFASLDLLRRTNGCASRPTEITRGEIYACRVWNGCDSGRDVRICLHDGGHGLPAGWGVVVREWFESER